MVFKTILVLILAASFLPAQNNKISGRITDAKTSEPISFVSVYLSGTTIGTATDKDGIYKIEKIPAGRFNLIVSMIGYNPIIEKISFKGEFSDIIKNFSPEPKVIELNQILISGESSPEWKKNLKAFKKYFLGQTELSDECTIENQNDLILTRDSVEALLAKCNSPIVVTNHALGYKIECLLMQFYCDENNKVWRISYAPKFTELIPAGDDEMKQWRKKREEQYLSSLHRFLRALIKNDGVDLEYSVTISNNNPDSRYPIYISSSLDSLFWKRHIIHREDFNTYVLSLGRSFYIIKNLLTSEKSLLQLPSGEAEIDRAGFPVDPFSINVFGKFGELGLANSVPQSYGIEPKE